MEGVLCITIKSAASVCFPALTCSLPCLPCVPRQAFADALVEEVNVENDAVWIHDYHLLVLPSLLRKRFNRIRCGQGSGQMRGFAGTAQVLQPHQMLWMRGRGRGERPGQ